MAGEKKGRFRSCYHQWVAIISQMKFRISERFWRYRVCGARSRNQNFGERLRSATAYLRPQKATPQSRQDLAAVKCCLGRDSKMAQAFESKFFLENRFMG
jgi:hypothetical protein